LDGWTDGRTRATGRAWVVFIPGRFIPPECRFCDVAKVAMIEKGRFSQIWLKGKYESNFLYKMIFISLTKFL
jgi:hypothetical protein